MTVSLALNFRRAALCATVALAAAAGGCSGEGTPSFFATGALGETPPPVAAKPAVDPVCVNLAGQIDKIRQDGSVERLEKAADGKTDDVKVKRTSLQTQAQLNKANAEFIAKCGPNLPRPAVTAAAAPAVPAVKTAAAVKVVAPAVAKPAAAASAGVTVDPPKQ